MPTVIQGGRPSNDDEHRASNDDDKE
jgi:hypothetical protein